MLKKTSRRFLVPLMIALLTVYLFVVSCFGNRAVQTDRQIPSPEASLAIIPSSIAKAISMVTPGPTGSHLCKHPYTDTSIWNVPVDWSVAKIHPQSDLMMTAFFDGSDWIGSDTTQYSPNIYYITNDTPLVPVTMRENSFRDAINDVDIVYGEPGATVWMPIPKNARPAPGSDSQLAVVNLESGEEWGIIYGNIDSFGNWSAGGTYRYHIRNSGIPPEGFAQRGAGISQLAGVILPCEVDRGFIDHAVTLAYDYPCTPKICAANGWLAVIPPFTKTDGEGGSQYDIPEGARIVIRPEISADEIHIACREVRGCIVWTLAMQKYGGFIVDDGGHPKTYAEGEATAHWDPEVWSSEMLRHIPKEWYAVLDWNSPFATVAPK